MFLEKFMRIHSRFATHLNRFYRTFFPASCILCRHPTEHSPFICSACQDDLPILSHHCYQCAQFLHQTDDSRLICGTCQKNPPPFERTYTLFPYQPPIIRLIIHLKFQQQLSFASFFSELFIKKMRETWYVNQPLPDLIIPMPLHDDRLRERGFNQALEIAKPIAKAFAIPLDIRSIKRIKPTAAQSGLSAKQRKQNIAHAFSANPKQSYANLSVAVMDDVITTGYTMVEFCKVLKQHGAKTIDVWCCARRG